MPKVREYRAICIHDDPRSIERVFSRLTAVRMYRREGTKTRFTIVRETFTQFDPRVVSNFSISNNELIFFPLIFENLLSKRILNARFILVSDHIDVSNDFICNLLTRSIFILEI